MSTRLAGRAFKVQNNSYSYNSRLFTDMTQLEVTLSRGSRLNLSLLHAANNVYSQLGARGQGTRTEHATGTLQICVALARYCSYSLRATY